MKDDTFEFMGTLLKEWAQRARTAEVARGITTLARELEQRPQHVHHSV